MKKQQTTYKLIEVYPPYTVEQWMDTYKGFVNYCLSVPSKDRKGQMWSDFMQNVKLVEKFLRSKGYKFIYIK